MIELPRSFASGVFKSGETMIAYILGFLAGVMQPVQTSVNGEIRARLGSPYITGCFSTAIALIVMSCILFITEGGIHIPFGDIAQNPAWIWCGGLCGTVIFITSVLSLPKIGSAMTVLLTAFGQIMTGLIIDNWGLFMSPLIRINGARVIGAVLVIIGVVLVFGKGEDSDLKGKHLYILLAIICGIACAVQVAINGAMTGVAGSPMRATFISMNVALIGFVSLTMIVLAFRGKDGLYDNGKPVRFKLKWWMIFGGLTGTFIVGINAVVAPLLGTGIVNILNLVGEMGMGLFIDAIGFLGIDRKPVTIFKMNGMLLMIGGTVIISLL